MSEKECFIAKRLVYFADGLTVETWWVAATELVSEKVTVICDFSLNKLSILLEEVSKIYKLLNNQYEGMSSYGNSKLQNKKFPPFPHRNSVLDENKTDVNEGVLELMKRHICIPGKEIWQYFPDLEDFRTYRYFVNNSFGTNVGNLPLQDNLLHNKFVDLVNDGNTRNLCSEKSCSDFWIEIVQIYPHILKMALKVLIPFRD